ncbi:MAG: DNA-processing protein DprA, partial [Armatimonadota bacterium]
LVRNDALKRSVAEFLGFGEAALIEEYGFTAPAASTWVSRADALLKRAEEEHVRLDAFGVRLATPADAYYPSRVEAMDPDPPGLLYLYGNTSLLGLETVAVVASRGVPFDAMEMVERLAEEHVLAGRVLVSGHDTKPYQRASVVPLRWGAPRIVVLDSGLFAALGPELKDEPFAAARLWRFQFDPRTDLAVSAVSPGKDYHRNSNKVRDRLVTSLASRLELAWVSEGGNMDKMARLALACGRQVRVNPIAPAAPMLMSLGAEPIE